MSENVSGFWGIVELLGHRRVAGFVAEVVFAGVRLVRVSPGPDVVELGDPRAPMFGAGSIYAIHPCTEAAARRAREDVGESVVEYYDRLTSRLALPTAELDELPCAGAPDFDDNNDDEPSQAAASTDDGGEP